ncbi:MAG: DNA-processing protein DprA [Thermodesulfobacteriota bacterium]|nr:DNA-processing protein DprA [Thermodesulfobacteriota bacterium]
MVSFLTDDTKAIILLCGVFANPLTTTEYNTLVGWLVREKLRPESLLQMGDLSSVAVGSKIDRHRLDTLLGRGVQLGFAVEEWQNSGLWIVSRSDSEYPERCKTHLRGNAPPLLFGIGNKSLLRGSSIAIVGSRNVDSDGGEFTRRIVEECAQNGMTVVSGAASGVDQIAMRSALDAGGKVIGVVADNLLKASIERHARHAIVAEQLLLISPRHPRSHFAVEAAMGRNKLIYAMADYALVVSVDDNKGGTWAGAEEELKRDKSIAVFVRTGKNVPTGNIKLQEYGALAWPATITREALPRQLTELARQRPGAVKAEPETLNLFDFQVSPVSVSTIKIPAEKLEPEAMKQDRSPVESLISSSETTICTVYAVVLPVLLAHLNEPVSVEKLSAAIDVTVGQLNVWLKKAVADGVVEKLNGPVRFVRGHYT